MKKYDIKRIVGEGIIYPKIIILALIYSTNTYRKILSLYLSTISSIFNALYIMTGSYGKALLCSRKEDSKQCIIKQISMHKLSRKEALLTEQEANLLKKLQHPNIVTFWESFSENSNLYIVMEFASGGGGCALDPLL